MREIHKPNVIKYHLGNLGYGYVEIILSFFYFCMILNCFKIQNLRKHTKKHPDCLGKKKLSGNKSGNESEKGSCYRSLRRNDHDMN